MTTILVWVMLQLGMAGRYPPLPMTPLSRVVKSQQTHLCTIAPVTYVRKQKDGDWHITLDDGTAKVVAEIIPRIPLTPPKKGQRVLVCGIRRYDQHHNWEELHPIEYIEVVKTPLR